MRGGFLWAKSAGVSCRPIKLRRLINILNQRRAFETLRSADFAAEPYNVSLSTISRLITA